MKTALPTPSVAPADAGVLSVTALTLALTPRGLAGLLGSTVQAWLNDRGASMGAALAHYTLFSMAPLLLIAVSVAGAVFGLKAARAEILNQLNALLGADGAAAVASLLSSVQRHGQSGIGTLFALIYKFIPRERVGWPDVWLGSAVTSLLFAVGKAAIGWYIGGSGVATGFGVASSIVVLLVWVYWSAQVFLLGAEFTWVFAHRYGSRRHLPGL